ncbi:MAG: kinase-like domain-containing protein [Monoraphidium minutum]|nr:MAG: kinase-like domain-containing protein [Monoraphidium minutum]
MNQTGMSKGAWGLPTMGAAGSSPAKLGSSKQLMTLDGADDLFTAAAYPQRTAGQLGAPRLPPAPRKPAPAPPPGRGAAGAAGPLGQGGAARGVTRLSKPSQIPALAVGAPGYGGAALGSTLTARPAGGGAAPPGSLPPAAATARAGYAPPQQRPPQQAAAPAGGGETGPISPAQALQRYRGYLTPYEQGEVLSYPQIYFLGKADARKVRAGPQSGLPNHGYDDDRGDYLVAPHDHVAYRYEVLGVLGRGSFGQVLRVLDYKTGAHLALKVIRNKKRFHAQAQVELRVLQHLRAHDPAAAHNVIHIHDSFSFRGHLCITFELLGSNLYELVKAGGFVGLGAPTVRRFAAQMLQSLRFLHRHRLIHCDLKPENVLLAGPSPSPSSLSSSSSPSPRPSIKVIDFGSSCFDHETVYTYIQSRFYRSPEVILGLPYGCSIDVWSLGCIMAELLTGYPLFPGEDEAEQLACIMEVMGPPPPRLRDAGTRRAVFFEAGGAPILKPNSHGKVRTPSSKTLAGVLRCADAGFLDLMERCLRWDPSERITPEQALQHPWFAEELRQQQREQATAAAAASARGHGRPLQGAGVGVGAAAGAARQVQKGAALAAAGGGKAPPPAAPAALLASLSLPGAGGAPGAGGRAHLGAAAAAAAGSDTAQAGTDRTPRAGAQLAPAAPAGAGGGAGPLEGVVGSGLQRRQPPGRAPPGGAPDAAGGRAGPLDQHPYVSASFVAATAAARKGAPAAQPASLQVDDAAAARGGGPQLWVKGQARAVAAAAPAAGGGGFGGERGAPGSLARLLPELRR